MQQINPKAKVFVIGSSNVDFIMTMPSLPDRGETVTGGRFSQTFGGKGTNQATAAVRAGAETHFVSCVGSDAFGAQMIETFLLDGMDVSKIKRSASLPSGAALVMIGDDGMNYLSVASGANHDLNPADLEGVADSLQSCDFLLLQMEIPLETNLRAVEMARASGVCVMLNFAPATIAAPELIRGVDLLVVNENETQQLTGIYPGDQATIESALAALSAMKVVRPVITLGAGGCAAIDGMQILRVPGFAVDVADTTAAGDTFCGALAVALAEGTAFSAALNFATAASALCVTRCGAQPSIPLRSEINNFLSRA